LTGYTRDPHCCGLIEAGNGVISHGRLISTRSIVEAVDNDGSISNRRPTYWSEPATHFDNFVGTEQVEVGVEEVQGEEDYIAAGGDCLLQEWKLRLEWEIDSKNFRTIRSATRNHTKSCCSCVSGAGSG
jgi:hypothetical protein